MRIDLHTHSDRSDGTDSPAELVRCAATAGIEVLGLTDHDTTEGWAEAVAAGEGYGVVVVRGIEISARHRGDSVHLLAYLPDPAHPPLAAELERVLASRNDRLPKTLAKLRQLGVDIDAQDVHRLAGNAAALGRPHVADALVERGVVADRDEAFARFLGPRGPAYVDRYAADLTAMIRTVVDAGGVPVLAHPWGRYSHSGLDGTGLSALRDVGLAGLEVDHQDHPPKTRDDLRAIASDLGLLVTGASDYHGTGKRDHDLGCNTTAPDQLERLLDVAAANAAASARQTPDPAGR